MRELLHTIDDEQTDYLFELETDVMPGCDICQAFAIGQMKTLKVSVVGEHRKFVDSFDICPDCLHELAAKVEALGGDA